MGLPATSNPEPTEAPSSSVKPTPSAPINPTAPKPVGSLPSAALDLASKLFDLARAGDTPTLNTYISAGIPKNLTNHAVSFPNPRSSRFHAIPTPLLHS